MLLFPAPQKFNTFTIFATFAIIANCNPALVYPAPHRSALWLLSPLQLRLDRLHAPLSRRRHERGQGVRAGGWE